MAKSSQVCGFINTREQFMCMREPDVVAATRADRAVGREALDS
jgi:hypothetical protein